MIRKCLVAGLALLVVALGVRAAMAMAAIPADQHDRASPLSASDSSQHTPCPQQDSDCCNADACASACVSFAAPGFSGDLRDGWTLGQVAHLGVPDQQLPDYARPPPAPPPRLAALS